MCLRALSLRNKGVLHNYYHLAYEQSAACLFPNTFLHHLLTNSFALLGNGSWATALAKILTDNGFLVHWYFRNEGSALHLKGNHHNPHYLTSVRFAAGSVLPSGDLEAVCRAAETILFAVPSAYAQPVLDQLSDDCIQNKTIISAVKGILPEQQQLLCDYLQVRGMPLSHFVAITGPCHAEEVAAERLSYLTFSGLDENRTSLAARAFQTDYLRTSCNADLWGAQYAAVLKNIYAIGAGMAHGLDYGDNFLSVYITACYRELYGFLVEHFDKVHPLPGGPPDFHTSAYLGDLLVTCYSLHSRNRTFGVMLGKGYSVKAATLEMNMVAEGYYAARGMQHIAGKMGISMPIANMIYGILWEGKAPRESFAALEETLS